MFPTCPYCHKTNKVYRKVRPYGWCEEFFDEYGDSDSINTDGMHFTKGKTFRCVVCNKIRRHVFIESITKISI